MRTRVGLNSRDDFPGSCIDDVPSRTLQFRNIECFPIRRDGKPVASSGISLVPDSLSADCLNSDNAVERRDIDQPRFGAGNNSLYVFRLLTFRNVPGGNAANKLIAVVDIEYGQADT